MNLHSNGELFRKFFYELEQMLHMMTLDNNFPERILIEINADNLKISNEQGDSAQLGFINE